MCNNLRFLKVYRWDKGGNSFELYEDSCIGQQKLQTNIGAFTK
jgi:hypothetical protein